MLSTIGSGTGTITRKALTLNAVTDTKVYDGTMASGALVQAIGLVAGDVVNATQSFDGKNAGNRTLTVNNGWAIADGNGGNNYVVTIGNTAFGTITQKVLQANATVNDKVYDGNTTATGSVTGLSGVVSGDTVNLGGSGVFAFVDRNAGNGKAVTVSGMTLSGADATNYTLASIANGTANIAKAVLTLTAAADSKTYDGTVVSSGVVTDSGLVAGDSISGVTQAFDSKNAGNNRVLSANAWTISDGNGGGNYTVVKVDAVGSIGQKLLSGQLTGTVTKVYDGTTTAMLLPANLLGVIAGDAVTVTTTSANYADQNAGTNKLVTVSGMAISGADAGNYVLQGTSTSANVGEITARQIAVSTTGLGAKTYDGTTLLAVNQMGTLVFFAADGDAATQALMNADGVALNTTGVTGTLADRNAGTGKGVTLTGYALDGNGLGNYVLTSATTSGLADIARAQLTLSAVADNKVYDGTSVSGGVVGYSGLVTGDSLTNLVQSFDSRNAGNRTLQVTGYTINDGNGGSNYLVTLQDAAGAISKRDLTTSVTVNDKVYDGTRTASGSFGPLQNVVTGDNVAASAVMTFNDRNAGTNKLVTISNATLTGADAGNYNLLPLASAATADITKASLVLTAVTDIRQYDGTRTSTGTVSGTGLMTGDSVTATQSFDNKNAGSRALRVDAGYAVNDGNGGNNYVVTLVDASGAITQRVLTTSVTVNTKEYDGTTAATGTFGGLQNVVAGETVTLSGGTMAFVDRNAGVGKAVNVSGATLGGADAANYVLSTIGSGTGTITRKALTLNAVTDTKVYDGTMASGALVQAIGLVAGDVVNATQSFDGKNAGNRTLTVNNGWAIADGNGGNNYVVTIGNTAFGTITQKVLQANATVNDKVYDGNTTATGSVTGLSGVVSGDTVNLGGSGVFAFVDRNAGNGKAVTVSGMTLSGADATNYTLASIANGTANIAKAVLTLTAAADSKTYDGTVVSSGVVTDSGLVAGDSISGVTQAFDSKNAGNNRVLSANAWTISDGNGGGNYTVVKVDAVGSIGQKLLSGQLTGTVTKVYDGTTTAMLLPANLLGVIAGDAVTVTTTSANYADQNAGTNKLVTVSGMAISGADAGNYVLQGTSTSANVGEITARQIAVSTTGLGAKTYDGTTLLAVNQMGTLVFFAADGDAATQALMNADGVALNTTGVTGTLADRNAGTGKGVTLTGYALDGNGLGNYVLTSATTSGLADIARAQLTLSAVADNKVYDGTRTSGGSVAINGLVTGDTVTATQAYDSRNAGTRLLQVGGIVLADGNGGGNYVVTLQDATGVIAKRDLTTSVTVNDKVYDGTTVATGTLSPLQNVIAGDDVAVAVAMAFADRNVGVNKAVTLGTGVLSGADAANYYLVSLPASAAATINKASLALTAVTDIRQYDGTRASSGAVQAAGLASGDSFTATQSFDNKNAGGRTLSVDAGYAVNDGNGGNNYVVTLVDASGAITQRVLTTSVTVNSKDYDGTTAATGTFGGLQNVVAGETVTLSGGTLAFADRNAGVGKAVNVTGATLGGADAVNYVLSTIGGGTGTITRKALTLNAVTDTKVYDGTEASATQVQVIGLVAGDVVNATQSFDSKNSGNRTLTVNGGWTVADGNGGANYVVTIGNSAAGVISRKELQVASQVSNKVYDGTTAANGTVTGLSGVVAGDNVTANGTSAFEFVDRNAGNGKSVAVSGLTLSGADAGNYMLGTIANGTANIARAMLTLTAVSDSKTYDGAATSAGTVGISGLVAGDSISGVTQSFDSKNAGSRTISADSWAINDGNDGGNYTVVRVAANGSIAQKVLTGQLTGTVSKVYDGTAVATMLPVNLDGVIASDVLTLTTSGASYADRNVGTGKRVTVSGMALTGADSANYVLLSSSAFADVGTITPRAVTVVTSGHGEKTYDGTTMLGTNQHGTLIFVAANGDVTTQALLAADGVVLNTNGVTGTLADRNAGSGKSVDLSGYTLDGNAHGNYELVNQTVRGVADVGRAQLTLTASGENKVYDGSVASSGNVQVIGLVNGDTVTATQAFDRKNAGNRTISVTSWLLNDGNGGGNYNIVKVDAGGTIAQKVISGQLSGTITKTYDGTTAATLLPVSLNGVIAGDAIAVSATSAAYDDRNVGTGKRVTVAGLALSGGDAGNYVLQNSSVAADTGIITARGLLVTLNNASKNQGQADPALRFTVGGAGLVAGDTLSGSAARDAGESVGTYAIRKGSLSAGANYTVTFADGVLTIISNGITPEVIKEAIKIGNQIPPIIRTGTDIAAVFGGNTTPWFARDLFGSDAQGGSGVQRGTGSQAGVGNQLGTSGQNAVRTQGTTDSRDGGENGQGTGTEESRELELICVSGSESDGSCVPASGFGLPYPTNRVITPIIRFLQR
ncbi:YDG domain-containing protein [Sphingobium sp. B1D7B]|uniref:YDG domain-containing protein n=1 Tax=Sphingobium sp. B1D7B TaxID=2940578 RepID=UPI002225644E|nr:YDG domain-containing protein [Sphingobium sp. B1D7B]